MYGIIRTGENMEDYSQYAAMGHNSESRLPEIVVLANAQKAAEEKVAELEEQLVEYPKISQHP